MLFLAPMAGYNSLAFRIMCRKHGADVVSTEMMSANAVHFGQQRDILTSEEEGPLSIQLFGNLPERLVEAVRWAEQYNPVLIDLNAGCPVPKVAGNGMGADLMKDPTLLARIVEAMTDAATVPVTVKIRAGWDRENAVETAEACERAGASMIAVHGRLATHGYSGKADWQVIKRVADSVGVPVIGNGDVHSSDDAERMIGETGCDHVMIGRAALEDPRVFSGMESTAKEDKIRLIEEYAATSERTGEISLNDLKCHALFLAKGFPGSPVLRGRISAARSIEEIKNAAKSI
ncbi:MAG: tRNA-dihydrouridine synthase family protein [Candidatus Diapherotrites archaeon]|nr:tRNA-dihydrouridine synthase family protein [Candidatus Diapherotrites archaeon]